MAASYSAGMCLASGKGCPLPEGEAQDWPEAFAHYLFAAEKGRKIFYEQASHRRCFWSLSPRV